MKKRNIFWSLVAVSIIFVLQQPILSQEYQLVWSDEFNGDSLNLNNWIRETGGNGWGNNELQFYTNREINSFVGNGILTIKAQEEIFGGESYTSARLKTQGKQFWKYGKVEARIKLPYSQGIWPAFWMLGESFSSVGWPACGEIDIMEMVGGATGDNTIYGTVHWEQNGHASYGGSYTLSSGIFADDYHTFSIIWDPQKIKWYMDDIKYHTINITPAGLSEFHGNFFIILNVAVGGNWPGNPDPTTVFPQIMEVDYVRVYKNTSELPNVSIINPVNNSNFDPGSDILLAASANVQMGDIQKVEFYQDAVQIGETTVSPYLMNWKDISCGSYSLYAVAVSEAGFSTTSEIITVNVGSGCIHSPYAGSPIQIPGPVEMENYNLGGAGIAYYDMDANNNGSQYRNSEGVDIELCSDIGGGYNLGWLEATEWLNYLIEVSETGTYQIEVRAAAENTGGSLHIEIDGVDKTGNITIPSTGGWQDWSSILVDNIELNSGEQELKVVIDNGGFNLNKINIYEPNTLPEISLISPNGGEVWSPLTVQEITWTSLKVSEVKIGLSTNNGSTWSFVTNGAPSSFGVFRCQVPETQSTECLISIIDSDNSAVIATSASTFTIGEATSVEENTNKLNTFWLQQNFPNPFNPDTKISFQIPNNLEKFETSSSKTLLKVYDMLGNVITTLINENLSAGDYEVNFDAGDLVSGIYFYSLSFGENHQVRKMILVK